MNLLRFYHYLCSLKTCQGLWIFAKLRVLVRRALRKYGYPPDLQAEAVRTALRQAETMAEMEAA